MQEFKKYFFFENVKACIKKGLEQKLANPHLSIRDCVVTHLLIYKDSKECYFPNWIDEIVSNLTRPAAPIEESKSKIKDFISRELSKTDDSCYIDELLDTINALK